MRGYEQQGRSWWGAPAPPPHPHICCLSPASRLIAYLMIAIIEYPIDKEAGGRRMREVVIRNLMDRAYDPTPIISRFC